MVDETKCVGVVSDVWAEKGGEVEAESQAMGGESELEIQRVRERERTALRSAFYKPSGAGWGATPKQKAITRIGRSNWPQPPARPGRDGRKRLHSTSGKMTPSCGIVSLQPHDMTCIAPHRTPRHELPCTNSRAVPRRPAKGGVSPA